MKKRKQNCPEDMTCGREPGGANARKLGVCPATTDTKKASAATHTGKVRKSNQDRYLIKKLNDGSRLLAVADGLGGHTAGDYAAEIVRDRLAGIELICEDQEQPQLESIVKELDLAIMNAAENDPELEGMCTTLVCALLRDEIAFWVHVGDSRIYRLHENRLIQITEDQTFARFLLEEGEITPEQFPTHYSQNIMDQCVGCGICEPETGRIELNEEDLLILTTDGLHDAVSPDIMATLLTAQTDLATRVGSLIQAALDAGGEDNITLVVAEI